MAGHDITTSDGKKFKKEIAELTKLQVRVGFQKGETDPENGADLADIAMFNELGTSSSPARPFMRQSVENNETQITEMCEAQLRAIVGGESTAKKALQQIGVMQKALIQNSIRNGNFEPNAPITINGGWMRTKGGKFVFIKGKKSDKPLIDTGRMRQSVNFVVKPKGED